MFPSGVVSPRWGWPEKLPFGARHLIALKLTFRMSAMGIRDGVEPVASPAKSAMTPKAEVRRNQLQAEQRVRRTPMPSGRAKHAMLRKSHLWDKGSPNYGAAQRTLTAAACLCM
jgi:hypothetical protein